MSQFLSKKRNQMGQSKAAWLLLSPFLAVYLAFMVYPFLGGIWISLHDWNLLEVAFNPDAKEFVGAKNYVRAMWGKNIEWAPFEKPLLQIPAIVALIGLPIMAIKKRISTAGAIVLALAALVFFVLPGFHPGEGGRWFDRRFWPAVGTTIVFVALTVPSVTIVALVLAVAARGQTRAMAVLRTLFFLSTVLSVTVVTLIWLIMFSPRQGIIANVMDAMGREPLAWLTNENLAMPALVIATVWWSLGIAMILFLAGLQDINAEVLEAAALDNARGMRAFWYIILPNLKRTITLVVVLQIIAHFQVFGQSHLMSKGGPNDTTQVLVRYIYQTGFRDSDLGEASAMAIFLFVVMGGFSVLQFILGRERD